MDWTEPSEPTEPTEPTGLRVVDAAEPVAQEAMAAYTAELNCRFAPGFVGTSTQTDPTEFRPPLGWFVAAGTAGAPLACGGLRLLSAERAEVKRMWVSPAARGRGLGRTVVALLERLAQETGCREMVLDTNGELREAVGLYRSCGYVEVPAYNDNPYADHWFAKRVG